eukprot:3526202-Pleurochrysis_carterae.AAC.1
MGRNTRYETTHKDREDVRVSVVPASMNCIAPMAMAALRAATFNIMEKTAQSSRRRECAT